MSKSDLLSALNRFEEVVVACVDSTWRNCRPVVDFWLSAKDSCCCCCCLSGDDGDDTSPGFAEADVGGWLLEFTHVDDDRCSVGGRVVGLVVFI